MTLHKRVFISNRGEIAIRIAKSATVLGVESVGVYPAIDALSLHTRGMTESHKIGTAEDSVGAYLNAQALVQTAKASGCDCLHPGYGFLSENAVFAELCAAEGITFIGPPPAALSLFGNKIRARALAESLGIPVVPGSAEPIGSVREAENLANELGYPVMLKAAAGGGGRGMRVVERAEQLAEAFARCRSEAQAAFGNGSVFIEKLVARPRHIEVQILADSHGNVVHLHERDCSVQLRHQKIVEVAPAPNLDADLREQMLTDAITLVQAAAYVNAGTVEFLVSPETGEYFFIECNPRIQVEHTVTEQVTGIDLVEAQFHIAAGATLTSLGLGDQHAVGAPRGFAVQARVVATSTGRLTAYKEPSGVGIRVDACGYLGYAPPSQFDPLLAKLICTSGAYAAAIERTLHALDEFHIGGLQTNVHQLRAILSHPPVQAGDARTSLLTEAPEIISGSFSAAEGSPLALLEQQAAKMGKTGVVALSSVQSFQSSATRMPALEVAEGQETVECPLESAVAEIRVREGDTVSLGDTLLVVSAMKMETMLTASCAGLVTAMQPLQVGDTVAAGQVVAVVSPSPDRSQLSPHIKSEQPWRSMLEEVRVLQDFAKQRLEPGSDDPGVVRQRARGKLTCRERILLVLDEGSFREVGSVAGFASYDEEGVITGFTPANSVGGWGKIDRRSVIVCADDFTSRGGHADGAIAAKSGYLDRLATEMRAPSLRLLDGSSGGGSVAAMVPAQKKEGESHAKESSGAIKAGRPRVAGGRWIVSARTPGQHDVYGTVIDHTSRQSAARQCGWHWRGQGCPGSLFGDGARYRPALCCRTAGRNPCDGLRHYQGGTRRLAHPLYERVGR